jgi:hypothetical protein
MRKAIINNSHVAFLIMMMIAAAPVTLAQRKQPGRQPQTQQQPAQQPGQQQTPGQSVQQQNQQGAPQMQGAQAPTSACANRPLCYEANDFVATVTEFRTSTDGRGSKILDALMHFQNKTSQPISLGYVDQSGAAIDDMGNRFILNTFGGGVRGMGVVAGTNMDPKFSLPGGGAGDARFELWWAPYGKLSGVNYEFELSIREMNRVEGNQWSLGDESLIHYQGLANGMGVAPVSGGSYAAGGGTVSGSGSSMGSTISSFVPGQTTNTVSDQQVPGQQLSAYSAQPCPQGTTATNTATNVVNTAGAQNQNANDAVTNASQAISNLGSLFGRKKNKANAANPNNQQANAAAPCTPVTNVSNGVTVPAGNAALQQRTTATPAVVTPAANTKGGMIGRAVAQPGVQQRIVPANQAPAAQRPVVTNTSLKQPAPATTKTTAPAKKPAATTPANTPTNGSGGAK